MNESAYNYEDDEYDDDSTDWCECSGDGWIITCIDDICHGQGWCMHGDGMEPCGCNPDMVI